jgi:hypothetical protein
VIKGTGAVQMMKATVPKKMQNECTVENAERVVVVASDVNKFRLWNPSFIC